MVKRAERKRMQDFVTGCIEEAGRYVIKKSTIDGVLIAQRPELVEQPIPAWVFLHSRKRAMDEYRQQVSNAIQKGARITNIFYNDGELFMVRLAERAHIKGDNKALKKYSAKERNAMIHIRDLEKKF